MDAGISHSAAIRLLSSRSLPSLVQKELERQILDGELPPGHRLNETEIAARLGVSRGPVREALRALDESGLVRSERNRGVFVRTVTVAEADETYDVRAALDELVGRTLAKDAGPAEIRELCERLDRMEAAAGAQDVGTYFAANLAFHDRLVELTGNATLLESYRRLVKPLQLFRRRILEQGGALSISTLEHRQIVEAIAAHDAGRAGAAMREHAIASKRRAEDLREDPSLPPLSSNLRRRRA